jgi:hypothetical protein
MHPILYVFIAATRRSDCTALNTNGKEAYVRSQNVFFIAGRPSVGILTGLGNSHQGSLELRLFRAEHKERPLLRFGPQAVRPAPGLQLTIYNKGITSWPMQFLKIAFLPF